MSITDVPGSPADTKASAAYAMSAGHIGLRGRTRAPGP